MSIYYKYYSYGSKLVVLSYFDECVYCYTYKELVNWFWGTLGKRFHVKFLGYAYLFMSIRISQLKDYSISVDQARYATNIVSKYLDTAKMKENSNIHKKIPCIMIWYSPNNMPPPLMNKWENSLDIITSNTELVWDH